MKTPVIAAAFCLFAFSIASAAGQDSDAGIPARPWSTLSDADIQKILIDRIDVQRRSVGIVVAVIDSKGQRVVSYGHLNQGDTRPLNGDTLFEIGSITKVFTTLLLSEMSLRGEVSLDDPVSKYLPQSVKMPKRDGKQIALIDLATHTSGLPRLPDNMKPADPANPYADYSVDQLYQFLGSYKLTRDIGTRYEYSNLGVGLLGHVLALRASQNYEALFRQRIGLPLGMKDTATALTPDMSARLAIGHNAAMNPVKNWDLPTLAGAGALRSTANDLSKLLAAELGFARTPLRQAMDKQLSVRRPTGAPTVTVMLGWHELSDSHGTDIEHSGGTAGYRTFIGFDQKALVGVVTLSNTNTDEGPDDIGRYILTGRPLFKVTDTVKTADVSGSWQVDAHYEGGGTAKPVCFFQQAGSRLTGTCKGPNSIGIATGSVSGQRIVFDWAASAYTPIGGSGVASFVGTVDLEKRQMSGTTAMSGVAGTFTAASQ